MFRGISCIILFETAVHAVSQADPEPTVLAMVT